MSPDQNAIVDIVKSDEDVILERWIELLTSGSGTGGGRIKETEIRTQCRAFLNALVEALGSGAT